MALISSWSSTVHYLFSTSLVHGQTVFWLQLWHVAKAFVFPSQIHVQLRESFWTLCCMLWLAMLAHNFRHRKLPFAQCSCVSLRPSEPRCAEGDDLLLLGGDGVFPGTKEKRPKAPGPNHCLFQRPEKPESKGRICSGMFPGLIFGKRAARNLSRPIAESQLWRFKSHHRGAVKR